MKITASTSLRLATLLLSISSLPAPAYAHGTFMGTLIDVAQQAGSQTATDVVPAKKKGRVLAVALSPDGRYLAVASTADSAIHVWSIKAGGQIAVLRGHIGIINAVDFTPDGTQLVSAGVDGTARIWNLPSGTEARKLRQQDGFLAVAVCPDGRTVATGGVDGFVRMWNLKDGTQLKAFQASDGMVSSLSFLPKSGKLVVSGGTDGKSAIWNTDAGTQVNVTMHKAPIMSVALSPDGARYLAGTAAGTTDIVDAKTAEIQGAFNDDMSFTTTTAIAPDLAYTLTGSSQDARVRMRMVQTSDRYQLIGHTQSIRSLVISPDSRLILTGSEDGSVRLWSAETRQQLLEIDVFADESWVMVGSDNKFDASAPEEQKGLGKYSQGLLAHIVDGTAPHPK